MGLNTIKEKLAKTIKQKLRKKQPIIFPKKQTIKKKQLQQQRRRKQKKLFKKKRINPFSARRGIQERINRGLLSSNYIRA